jgi:hypothetical protein
LRRWRRCRLNRSFSAMCWIDSWSMRRRRSSS